MCPSTEKFNVFFLLSLLWCTAIHSTSGNAWSIYKHLEVIDIEISLASSSQYNFGKWLYVGVKWFLSGLFTGTCTKKVSELLSTNIYNIESVEALW